METKQRVLETGKDPPFCIIWLVINNINQIPFYDFTIEKGKE